MSAKTFWQWYDKELPSGDDASNFQAAWDAAIESIEENCNSLQQLKAEIAAIADSIEKGYAGYKNEYFCHRPTIINKLRQLSAD